MMLYISVEPSGFISGIGSSSMKTTLQAETTGLVDFLILVSRSVEVDCLMLVQLLTGETDNRSTSQIAESELSLVGELAGFPCSL